MLPPRSEFGKVECIGVGCIELNVLRLIIDFSIEMRHRREQFDLLDHLKQLLNRVYLVTVRITVSTLLGLHHSSQTDVPSERFKPVDHSGIIKRAWAYRAFHFPRRLALDESTKSNPFSIHLTPIHSTRLHPPSPCGDIVLCGTQVKLHVP